MEFELKDPPQDGLSSIYFHSEDPSLLLASSWDKTVRLYDTENNLLRGKYEQDAPVLDCHFLEDTAVCVSGGLDKKVYRYDWNKSNSCVLGEHDAPIKSIVYSNTYGALVTGSWDKTLRMWDERTSLPTGFICKQNLPGKVYTMDATNDKIIVGMSNQHIWIYDLRMMEEPLQKRESSLKYQTRCIKSSPTAESFVVGTIEGRVAVEYIDLSPEFQSKKYAFKCHRRSVIGVETVHPVHSITFHPIFGTFATGGGDGVVNIWDGVSKKRLRQLPAYHTSISCLSFNATGTLLAVGASYAFEEGEKDHPPDSIFIRVIGENEVKPKSI